MVDKNVPLNRLVLKSKNWLNEAFLKGLATNFEDEKYHFIRRIQQAEKARGVGAKIGAPRFCLLKRHFDKKKKLSYRASAKISARWLLGKIRCVTVENNTRYPNLPKLHSISKK